MTNADHIRQMTDDEELLREIGTKCYRCIYNDGECLSRAGELCFEEILHGSNRRSRTMSRRNCDKLREQSLYDLLCMMNVNLRERSVFAPCVISVLGADRIERCLNNEGDCAKCLQSWLNEDSLETDAEISEPLKTNADRIRKMTDEELAEWLDNEAGCSICRKHPTQCDVDCYSGYLEWLKQEVSEDAGND